MRQICSYSGLMNRDDERRIAARMAKTLAIMCVRNTGIETLHAGVVPVTHSGDYSDVRVIDADGREIAWNEVSHLDDDQMRALMKEIVNRLYTFNIWAPPSTRHQLGDLSGFGFAVPDLA